jgi:hypothetical protein
LAQIDLFRLIFFNFLCFFFTVFSIAVLGPHLAAVGEGLSFAVAVLAAKGCVVERADSGAIIGGFLSAHGPQDHQAGCENNINLN